MIDKLKLLKDKNYSLLLFGMVTSNLGTSVSSVAMILFFLKNFTLAESTKLITGYWTTKLLAETILTPYVSKFIDYLDRKKIIIYLDIIRGILYISFSFFIFVFNKNMYFFIFYFIIFTLSNFFQTAIFSIVPSIVDKNLLDETNSLTSSFMEFSWLIGGILGGIFYERISMNVILFADGVTFLLSALSEVFLIIPKLKVIDKENYVAKLIDFEFYKKINRNKSIKFILIFEILLGLLLSSVFRILMPYFANNIINVLPSKFGLFDSIMTLGIVLGAFTYKKNSKSIYDIIFNNSCGLGFLFIIFLIMIMFVRGGILNNYQMLFYISCTALMLTGVLQARINIPILTLFQKIVDKNELGKFYGMRIVMIKIAMIIGIRTFSFFIKNRIQLGFLIISSMFFVLGFIYKIYFKKIINNSNKELSI